MATEANMPDIGNANPAAQSVELDLDKFGELGIAQGSSKPEFKKVTEVEIVNATLKTAPERKEVETKAGKKQSFYPVFLSVEYEFQHEGAPATTYENFGGGRLFSGGGSPTRFWVGEKSALGSLISLLKDHFDFSGTIKEIPELIKGKKCGVITEHGKIGSNEYTKNIIKVFYK